MCDSDRKDRSERERESNLKDIPDPPQAFEFLERARCTAKRALLLRPLIINNAVENASMKIYKIPTSKLDRNVNKFNGSSTVCDVECYELFSISNGCDVCLIRSANNFLVLK